jgi:hypothetical protein
VLISRLLVQHPNLRIVVVDTHGEYAGLGGVNERGLRVRFEPCLLDEEWVRRACRAGRALNQVMETVYSVVDDMDPGASLDDVAGALEAAAPSGQAGERVKRLADEVRQTPNLCLSLAESTVIEIASGPVQFESVDWSSPGFYVLDLGNVFSAAERVRQAGAIATAALQRAKYRGGQEPMLLVVDEAQNYAPEQQTGRLASARASFEPLFEIVTEGRKFNCGLLIASQRPARVNKDVLSQCNTQFIFRMVSVEDLDAVRDCFEGASLNLLAALPGYPTGSCYAGGVSLAMGVQLAFPLAATQS